MSLFILSCSALLCLAVAAIAAAIALILRKRKPALYIMTGGVYLALLLLFLTYNRGAADLHIGYRLLFAAHDAAEAFFLKYKPDVILKFPAAQPGSNIRLFVTLLLPLAPLLTVSNVLAQFQSLVDRMRYRFYRGEQQYILSEVNEESLVLANSIRQEYPHAQIVFTGVGKDEKDAELPKKARELAALCLKCPVTQLRLRDCQHKKYIFLISRNEPENVANAIALTEQYKEKPHNIELYVYASAPESKIAIDAVDKGDHVLNPSFRTHLDKELASELDSGKQWDQARILEVASKIPLESSFSVRCVDTAELTVRNVLEDHFDAIHTEAQKTKTVSITLLGFGRHGSALLKTAVWMFQLYGYRLEINVFDKDGTAGRRLKLEAPELLQDPNDLRRGDASHDILFMGGDRGNDCQSSDFDDQFRKYWQRLKKTQLVFVSLGDDSRNIAAAIRFRELFQRKQIETALEKVAPEKRKETVSNLKEQCKTVVKQEMPLICAMVADPNRSASLTADSSVDEEDRSRFEYNILPVGSPTSVYSFRHIQELMRLEKLALRCHLLWCVKDILQKKDAADAGKKDNEGNPIKMDRESALDKLVEETKKYVQDSYYRDSSVAMAVHQVRMLNLEKEFKEDERKEKCMVTEHMRWNAYMRSRGYRQHAVRCDRAKLHPLIVSYYDLSRADQEKDLVKFNEEEVKCILQDLLTPPV